MSELPEMCISHNSEIGEYILIKKNESGYFETDITTEDEARSINDYYKVTEEQRLAMEAGSMWGWDVSAADPEHKLNKFIAEKNRQSGDALGA